MDDDQSIIDPDQKSRDDALLARVMRLTKKFAEKHPSRVELRKFIERTVKVNSHRGAERRSDHERVRAVDDLHALHDLLVDLLGDIFEILQAPIIEERTFGLLHRFAHAAIALGQAQAPDGTAGREAWSDQASTAFVRLVQVVTIYLREHPELEPMSSIGFARQIRPDILAAMGLPPTACSPAPSAILKALRAIKKGSFVL